MSKSQDRYFKKKGVCSPNMCYQSYLMFALIQLVKYQIYIHIYKSILVEKFDAYLTSGYDPVQTSSS